MFDKSLLKEIHNSEKTQKPAETILKTDSRILARITDGIYRKPASALRELISNAYDADATEVVILTDYPRFQNISVRDNGQGISPEVLEHLVHHIGGSPKRVDEGKTLGVTSGKDISLSPGGRKLIGKLGIGLFSVAQFTRHFLIISKVKNDKYRTVAEVVLGPVAGQERLGPLDRNGRHEIQNGTVKIWREKTDEKEMHGTEIKLLELLPRTKAELASDDRWKKIELENENPESIKFKPPKYHIGKVKESQSSLIDVRAHLPWADKDSPRERFLKFVSAIQDHAENYTDSVDLETLCDSYLQTLWNLSLSAPLEYVQGHPFDFKKEDKFVFYQLDNRPRGQATHLKIDNKESLREELNLKSPDGSMGNRFEVFMDGVQLLRPILFKDLPMTSNSIKTPLLFAGKDYLKFEKKHIELSGGPLSFEAYLFWAPKIIPKQHQGVILRVGNASGALFDRTFMDYQVSEQTRLRQITAEIFVQEGLDGAINLDRESFNFAHPHYQYLVKWLHSALRQFANRQKELGRELRSHKLSDLAKKVREDIEKLVEGSLNERGVNDLPEVLFIEQSKVLETRNLRKKGVIVLRKEAVLPASSMIHKTEQGIQRRKLLEKKAMAVAQLLYGWGLLDEISFEEQEKLLRVLLEIIDLE